MFAISKLRALKVGECITSGNGFVAKANSNGTISFMVRKKFKGSRVLFSRTILHVSKHDTHIGDALTNSTKVAMDWIHSLSQGIDPLQDIKQKQLEHEQQVTSLEDLLKSYEESRHSYDVGNAPKTMRDRRNTLTNVFGDWLDKPITYIDKRKVMDRYNLWASGQYNKRPQAQKGIRYLRSVLNYAKDTLDLIEKNPCDIFKGKISMKNKMDTKQYLKPSETKTMLRYINGFISYQGGSTIAEYGLAKDAESEFSLQSYNAIKLMLYSGLRLSEVLTLKWNNVYLEGTEFNSNPYFEVMKLKQQEPFGIPITEHMVAIFDRQKMVQTVKVVNPMKAVMETKPKSEYVFPSPTRANAPMTSARDAFDNLNIIMPRLINAKKIGANQLRHTFATMAFSVGYAMSEIDALTGHGITGRSNVATDAYVGRVADDNRMKFIRVHDALHGKIIRDDEVIEIIDEVDKQLQDSNPSKIIELYDRGLLTKEEKQKYNTDAIGLKRSIILEEIKLEKLKKEIFDEAIINAHQLHIEELKLVLKRLEE